MIQKALQFTSETLQLFLKNTFGLDEDKVILNTLIESDGSIPKKNQNKIIVSLINLEHEEMKPFEPNRKKLQQGNYDLNAPSEQYNLDILIASNFDDYNETLKFLNEVILFFQVHHTINTSTNSNIPKGITKLAFELEKNTYHQIHALWNSMGAKYRPSVIYKMSLLTVNPSEIDSFDTAITKISSSSEV